MKVFASVGECPICSQGRLLIAKEKKTGFNYILCEECESEWAYPGLPSDLATRDQYGESEFLALEEAAEHPWKEFIKWRHRDSQTTMTAHLDFVETWWRSQAAIFESAGVTVRYERSPESHPHLSCSINLRRDASEADLVLWEWGEAELTIGYIGGAVSMQHFDDLRDQKELEAVLSRALSFVS